MKDYVKDIEIKNGMMLGDWLVSLTDEEVTRAWLLASAEDDYRKGCRKTRRRPEHERERLEEA